MTRLYGRLDELREVAAERLAAALRQSGGTQQERSQRDNVIGMHTEQVAQYDAVENGLCFGRLDFNVGPDDRRYIGRIGLFDEAGGYEPLLLDWRAPAARPFYLATAAAPAHPHRQAQGGGAGRRGARPGGGRPGGRRAHRRDR